jgi:hypothetical protein
MAIAGRVTAVELVRRLGIFVPRETAPRVPAVDTLDRWLDTLHVLAERRTEQRLATERQTPRRG